MKKFVVMIWSLTISGILFAQDSTTRKLNELVSAYASQGKFNGSVLVAAHGNILLEKGYGLKNAAGNTMNDSNTIFQIASITKKFTSTVVLKMVEFKEKLKFLLKIE